MLLAVYNITAALPQDGPPISGTWNIGDRVWNQSPSTGESVGWVCTSGGAPGTWKPFGEVDYNNISKTIVDGKGELIVATGADAVTRLPAGPNTYVLTADDTQATGVKWSPNATGSGVYGTWQWVPNGTSTVSWGQMAGNAVLPVNCTSLTFHDNSTNGLSFSGLLKFLNVGATIYAQAVDNDNIWARWNVTGHTTHAGSATTITVELHETGTAPVTGWTNVNVLFNTTGGSTSVLDLIDAKGDLVAGTADNAVARVPIGTDTHVLTADSTQPSGMKWAPGGAAGAMVFRGDWNASNDYAANDVVLVDDAMYVANVAVPGIGTTGYIAGTYAVGSNSAPTLTVPGATQTGDLMFLHIARYFTNSATPSGWTLLNRTQSGELRTETFTRVRASGDSGTITLPSIEQAHQVSLRVYRGIAAHVHVSTITGLVAPAISGSSAHLALREWTVFTNSSSHTVPAGIQNGMAPGLAGNTIGIVDGDQPIVGGSAGTVTLTSDVWVTAPMVTTVSLTTTASGFVPDTYYWTLLATNTDDPGIAALVEDEGSETRLALDALYEGGSSGAVVAANETRSDTTTTYSYMGIAPDGTADSATGWEVTRITLTSPPVTQKGAGTWTGRAGLTYS